MTATSTHPVRPSEPGDQKNAPAPTGTGRTIHVTTAEDPVSTAPFDLDSARWADLDSARWAGGVDTVADEIDPTGADLILESATAPEQLPCRVQDPDLWFAETPSELERAKAFCADCPVRAACLAGALARREPWGVWGGEIFDHGSVIARKRPRGRPRKDAGVAA